MIRGDKREEMKGKKDSKRCDSRREMKPEDTEEVEEESRAEQIRREAMKIQDNMPTYTHRH